METEILSAYPIAEYLLVLEPHEALCSEISKLKKSFAATYDCAAAAIGKPNITLIRFQQYEMLEWRIIRRLQLVAQAQHSFVVELHDFGSFPSHSIFLNVTTKTQIVELVKAFRPMQQDMKIDKDRKPHFITEPYINIARKLLPWQYEKGWLELSNTHFSGKFLADHFLLLRKKENGSRFEMIKKFVMLNEKETSKQGQLFI